MMEPSSEMIKINKYNNKWMSGTDVLGSLLLFQHFLLLLGNLSFILKSEGEWQTNQ